MKADSKQAQQTAAALKKLQDSYLGRLRVETRRGNSTLCVSDANLLEALGYGVRSTEERQERSGKHMGRRYWTVFITLTEAGKAATL